MRKLLLVTFVGIVLALNLFGIVKDFVSTITEDTSMETIVYVE